MIGGMKRGLAAVAIMAGVLVLAVLVLLAIQFSDSVRRLASAPQDNAIWAVYQLEYELERTRTAIAELSPGDLEKERAFLNRFDILYSRYDLLAQSGGFGEQMRSAMNSREWLEFVAFMKRMTPAIDQNRGMITANKEALREAFADMVPSVRRLAVKALREANTYNSDLHDSLYTTVGAAVGLILALVTGLIGVIVLLLRQARALAAGRQALEDSEQFNRAITRASLDGVIVIDRSGMVIEYSQNSLEIFGHARAKMLGSSIYGCLVPDRLAGRLKAILARADSDVPGGRRLEVRGLHASGREIPIELSVRAVRGAQGVIFVAFVRDITTRKAEARQMQKARELAEAESARKARYAAFVSHEIRTPLNSLLLVIDLLRSPHGANEHEELLASAASASEALLGIVNEVLDFSRLEAGAVSLATSPQNPARLLEQAAEIALPLARHRGNQVELDIDPELRPVLADAERLKQVLLNLIGNAVKATQNGEIRIAAKLLRRTEGMDLIEFAVTDTGSGIAPERLGQIFEEFATFGAGAPARLTGVGLGLPIARRLIAAMGADIEVESKPGSGSRFSFRLRLPPAETLPADAAPEKPLEASARAKLSVLVVDDDDLNRMALERVLVKAGHAVRSAASGAEAVTLSSRHVFDVIFVDQLMPNMDGVETVRRIRALGRNTSFLAHIVVVTAYASEEDRVRLQQAGANDYLPKPLRRAAVEKVLESQLRMPLEPVYG